ncbi:hypothetical protein [Sulfuricurvum sp.]|uniref:hypothetical protein n=1 Tax=Sulfuricurvum sp. TaxID=2025608 RepID=UPI00261CDB0B|nr:hypothetical protein [Sulfuricurvum sp.]MDD2265462.1 hypothetical protein [Sulfuricurvum sp.]MDD2782881.1 hypothetical protein [Sulfuricurvum sp.]
METTYLYPEKPKPIYPLRNHVFEHLGEVDFTNLIHRYYDGEKVTHLLKEYDVKVSVNKFASCLPYFTSQHMCPYCVELAFSVGSKSEKDGNIYVKMIRECYQCGHKIDPKNPNLKCDCAECQNYFEDILNNDISTSIEHAKSNAEYEATSEYTKLMIAALLRSGQSEHDLELIKPVFLEQKNKLSPTPDMSIKIISTLKRSNWIRFGEDSKESCFTIEDGEITRYVPLKTTYRLNLVDDFGGVTALTNPDLSNTHPVIMYDQWLEIAQAECFEYLVYHLHEYNLPDDIGPKTKAVIYEGLKRFSVSQMFNFIWRAAKNAAAYYQKDRVTKQHALNSIPGSMQRDMDRAVAEGWDVKGYSRNYNLPRSIYAGMFYDLVLKMGDKAIDMVIPVEAFAMHEKG